MKPQAVVGGHSGLPERRRSIAQIAARIRAARRVCIFGVGVLFADCFRQLVLALGREPDFLCDNAPEKWRRSFFGIPCLSPDELRGLGGDTAVVIAVKKYESICRQLRGMGLTDIYVACFDRGYEVVRAIQPPPEEDMTEPPAGLTMRGRWTLVTGASRGIGRQIALAMAGLGANLIVHSRDLAHTGEVVANAAASGVEVLPIAADLADPDAVERMLDALTEGFPEIDVIFNNAGISLPGGADPWSSSAGDYLTHYTVNTVAPVRICHRLIPGMIARGFGRVINVTSTIQRRAGEMAYACSKAALSKFVHDLAPSLAETGVMLSLVCPGHVRSDMGGAAAPNSVESVVPGILLGALLDDDVNGRCFIAQDYAGLDLAASLRKATFYYGGDRRRVVERPRVGD